MTAKLSDTNSPHLLPHLQVTEKEELHDNALKMFELGKVSSSKAAVLAGMSRVDFIET